MAVKKPNGPASTANGAPTVEPVVEPAHEAPQPAKMTKIQLQRRVRALEEQVARLKAELDEVRGPQVPWWHKIVGIYEDDPAFEEAMRLGREWRESFRPKARSSKKKKPQKAKSSDGRS